MSAMERIINASTLLTNAEAAQLLGCKPQTLRKWRLEGRGPSYIRLGEAPTARVAYRLSEIETWLSEHTFKSTSQETVLKAEHREASEK